MPVLHLVRAQTEPGRAPGDAASRPAGEPVPDPSRPPIDSIIAAGLLRSFPCVALVRLPKVGLSVLRSPPTSRKILPSGGRAGGAPRGSPAPPRHRPRRHRQPARLPTRPCPGAPPNPGWGPRQHRRPSDRGLRSDPREPRARSRRGHPDPQSSLIRPRDPGPRRHRGPARPGFALVVGLADDHGFQPLAGTGARGRG